MLWAGNSAAILNLCRRTILLKLTPCGYEDNWYRWNQEIPPGSPKELVQAAKEFSG